MLQFFIYLLKLNCICNVKQYLGKEEQTKGFGQQAQTKNA